MKQWIALWTAMLLLALCACGADPDTTAAPQTTPTTQSATTTAAPTTQPATSDPVRVEGDTNWGMYGGKMFSYSPPEDDDKYTIPVQYILQLRTDGSYKSIHSSPVDGTTDAGYWEWEDNILCLYASAYDERLQDVSICVTRLQYADGVLIFLKGSNDIPTFREQADGVTFQFRGALK